MKWFRRKHKVEWIKVSDRLPDKDGYYMCAMVHSHSIFYCHIELIDGMWNVYRNDDGSINRSSEMFPTAWLAVPPYEEDENEHSDNTR